MPGSRIVIVGPRGSGKTTLAKALNGPGQVTVTMTDGQKLLLEIEDTDVQHPRMTDYANDRLIVMCTPYISRRHYLSSGPVLFCQLMSPNTDIVKDCDYLVPSTITNDEAGKCADVLVLLNYLLNIGSDANYSVLSICKASPEQNEVPPEGVAYPTAYKVLPSFSEVGGFKACTTPVAPPLGSLVARSVDTREPISVSVIDLHAHMITELVTQHNIANLGKNREILEILRTCQTSLTDLL